MLLQKPWEASRKTNMQIHFQSDLILFFWLRDRWTKAFIRIIFLCSWILLFFSIYETGENTKFFQDHFSKLLVRYVSHLFFYNSRIIQIQIFHSFCPWFLTDKKNKEYRETVRAKPLFTCSPQFRFWCFPLSCLSELPFDFCTFKSKLFDIA